MNTATSELIAGINIPNGKEKKSILPFLLY